MYTAPGVMFPFFFKETLLMVYISGFAQTTFDTLTVILYFSVQSPCLSVYLIQQ
jgi:hypothetical protein